MYCPQCFTNSIEGAKFCAKCGTQLSAAASAAAEPEPRHLRAAVTAPHYAGFWVRTLAAIIDFLLSQVAIFIIVIPIAFALAASMADTASVSQLEAAGERLGFVVGVFVQWMWFTISESSKWQATIGKKIIGLKVTDENGERIGFGKANGRYWSKILSGLILFVGFLMVAFTAKKQGLHDKIAGTLVVKANT